MRPIVAQYIPLNLRVLVQKTHFHNFSLFSRSPWICNKIMLRPSLSTNWISLNRQHHEPIDYLID